MTESYVIGVDFGTESGRVLLVDVKTGQEIATHVTPYDNGVMDHSLPDGTLLGKDWALQDPNDYLQVLYRSIPEVLRSSSIRPEHIIGIGIDFTSSTILPLDQEGQPLCFNPKWKSNPHSWVKLWKHHAAQEEADIFTRVATDSGEGFIKRYGGKVSSEWLFPKAYQIMRESPEIYEATDLFIEACDWITYQLTNKLIRSSNTCEYKAFWSHDTGYPDSSFLRKIDQRLEAFLDTKMRGRVQPIGEKAGELSNKMAQRLGLLPGTAVAVGIIDAHASVPAVGAVNPGQMVMALGTSTCHMVTTDQEKVIEGICGLVKDGIIPGYYSYETGQVAVGDAFAWYVEHSTPEYITQEAKKKGNTTHELLEKKAAIYKPGESGILALDWWNGNRSVLVDANLTGMIIGLTISTKPEEIYRALLESTAFGTRKIIENFADAGIEVNEIFAAGGLPQRNKLLMQIYADVTNREIKIADSQQTTALGAAMYASVAAGKANGGYDNLIEAAKHMSRVKEVSYVPIPENVETYHEMYKLYLELHDYFGRERKDIMHTLKNHKVHLVGSIV
ncbi:ribulokinase [Metabacillus arenae]|uniref:Ribulokinase n=1 Tax=Metabacillus arenae TaxID=2771434 RepID=A0A926NKM2_9BACI|nr:ribulokinase [Metabacillus arenae]MBD1383096.1 ribulokinase [Metabacillus arenae]